MNFDKALNVLEKVATIEAVEFPDLPYEETTCTIFFAEAYSTFEDFIESGQIEELTAPEDRYSPYARTAILAKDYIRALRIRGVIAREVERVVSRFDALIAPTRHTAAPSLEEDFPSVFDADAQDVMGAIGNGTGLPAISVPNGFSEKGLPTGIQFMGRAYDENTIIAVARAYQSLTDWHRHHPPDLESF